MHCQCLPIQTAFPDRIQSSILPRSAGPEECPGCNSCALQHAGLAALDTAPARSILNSMGSESRPLPMKYTCRHLSPSDVPVLKSLLRVFGEAFEDMATYQGAVPDEGYLQKLLARSHFIVIAAMRGAEVVGGLAAYELEKFEQDRREIYIYDLAVAGNHRRRGIATTLIRDLQRIARERKAYVIYVQADREDEPAIRLYQSLGRKEDVHHFDIPVEQDTRGE